jgi:hypothetical protein
MRESIAGHFIYASQEVERRSEGVGSISVTGEVTRTTMWGKFQQEKNHEAGIFPVAGK